MASPMQSPTMLYRCPGPESFEGVACETTVVDESAVGEHLAAGWCRNWIEADAAAKAKVGEKLKANEAEQARVVEQLRAAEPGAAVNVPTGTYAFAGDLPSLTAVHKGRGKWDVLDAAGAVVASGLTGEEAKARAAG